MKGMELPVNTLIILVIAIIVLIAIVAFFWGVYDPSKQGMNLETAKTNACMMLNNLGCGVDTSTIAISGFDANKNGVLGDLGADGVCTQGGGDNLHMLCKCYYGISGNSEEEDCKTVICNCPK